MAPIVKDVETTTAASLPAGPSGAVAKPPQDAAPKPQPVPLEVPVSVNGARTIEGTDKREPFSEATKTVLVFANGAVIRLAANVTPGQLLFVTNDKSKKEVVCQVVKSKNYRTVTGYVELEFTEPAAGFWGIRIPTDPAAPVAGQSTAPKAPVAPRPAAPVAPVPPAATTTNRSAIAPPPLPQPVVAPPPAAPPASVKPEVANLAAPVIAHSEIKPEPKAPAVAEVPVQPVTPPSPVAAKPDALPTRLTEQFSALMNGDAGVPAIFKPQTVAPPSVKPELPHKSSGATTEELRQQAARLQEQLSSLLFRQEAAEKQNLSVPAPTVAEPVKQEKPPTETPIHIAPVIQNHAPARVETVANPVVPDAKLAAIVAPAPETKLASAVLKPASFNLKVEEVQIPSWLAPISRESNTAAESAATSEASSSAKLGSDSFAASASLSSTHEEGTSTGQSVVFGGQLLGGGTSNDQKATSSGSKTGLVLGLAAAAALLIGGGVWYGRQPGNFLNPNAPAAHASAKNSSPASRPAEVTETSSSANNVKSTPAPAPVTPAQVNNKPFAAQSVNVPPAAENWVSGAPSAPAPKSANLTAHDAPAPEQPKKPALGNVHLATPNVNRGGRSASSEAAPAIDSTDASNVADPLVGIAGNHGKQPTAPIPVGGDVKSAHLVKSVPPVYPPAARTQHITGDVQLDALIDADGNVTSTKIISGPVMLHQAAVTAVKQWKYAPAMLNDKPTYMHLTVTVQFRIQ